MLGDEGPFVGDLVTSWGLMQGQAVQGKVVARFHVGGQDRWVMEDTLGNLFLLARWQVSSWTPTHA